MKINLDNILLHRSSIRTDAQAVLLLSFLHFNKQISDESLKACMLLNRKGKFIKTRRTYKSNINGKWYNSKTMIDILIDVWKGLKDKNSEMTYLELWPYLNLFLTKNRYRCIEYFKTSILNPYVGSVFAESKSDKYLKEQFDGLGIGEFHPRLDTIDYGAAWCCVACDGYKDDFIRKNRTPYFKAFLNKVNQRITDELNVKKQKKKWEKKF